VRVGEKEISLLKGCIINSLSGLKKRGSGKAELAIKVSRGGKSQKERAKERLTEAGPASIEANDWGKPIQTKKGGKLIKIRGGDERKLTVKFKKRKRKPIRSLRGKVFRGGRGLARNEGGALGNPVSFRQMELGRGAAGKTKLLFKRRARKKPVERFSLLG